jgi:hypothetical protein
LKRFRLSLIYIVGLVVLNLFHSPVRSFLASLTGEKFIIYLLYGLFFSFFLIALIRVFRSGKNVEMATVMCAMALIFFFLLSRPFLLFKLSIAEFFILGVILFIDGKKSRSNFAIALALLVSAALLAELAGNLFASSSFYYFDVWMTVLFGLAGYITMGLGFKK